MSEGAIMEKLTLRLENLDDFLVAMIRHSDADLVSLGLFFAPPPLGGMDAKLFCPACQGPRRMRVVRWFWNEDETRKVVKGSGVSNTKEILNILFTPSAHSLFCVECDSQTLAVIYIGPHGRELALLRSVAGGLASPNTAPGVAYYLDQANRAQSVGANSAALAMFRSALEHLLHEQGFTQEMCGAKIKALEEARKSGAGPKWAADLDPEDLRVLKRLGDGAIHTNGGDVSKQDVATSELISAVALEFEKLITIVYERPMQDRARQEELKRAAGSLRGE